MRKMLVGMVAGIALAVGVYGGAVAAPGPASGPVLRQQATPNVEVVTQDDYSGLSNDVDSGGDDSHSNE